MNRPIPWKKYPMAAGTILPSSVNRVGRLILDVRAKELYKLGIAGVGKLPGVCSDASCPVSIIAGVSRRSRRYDDDEF